MKDLTFNVLMQFWGIFWHSLWIFFTYFNWPLNKVSKTPNFLYLTQKLKVLQPKDEKMAKYFLQNPSKTQDFCFLRNHFESVLWWTHHCVHIIAILAIYRFDAMFDTDSGLAEKCKHSLAQLEYSWQFCKTNVSKFWERSGRADSVSNMASKR